MPLTSIIIPTHDRPDLLQRAIESARTAGKNIEIVVVDDGSTDATSAVCASLPDIVYVRIPERRGVGFARAAGIEKSSGEYISFLDDDDVRLPGSIDRQVAVLEAAPEAAFVYGQIYRGTQSLGLSGRVAPPICPTGDVFWPLMAQNFVPSIAVVARRRTIDEVGGVHCESAPADDWDLWLRITERHPVTALPEPVAIYREPTLWSKQGSSRVSDGLLPADLRVLKRVAKLPRVKADPRAFRSAKRSVKRVLCNRLLAETFEAARFAHPYAFVSLTQAVIATPGALVRTVLSRETWRKFGKVVAATREAGRRRAKR